MSLLVPELTNGHCSEQICLLEELPLPKVWTWTALRFVTPELGGAIHYLLWWTKNVEELLVVCKLSNMGEKAHIHKIVSSTSVVHYKWIIHILLAFRINVDTAACCQQSTNCWPLFEMFENTFSSFFLFPSNFKKLFVWWIHMLWCSTGNNYIC